MYLVMISGSYPPMHDGVGDYTRTMANNLARELRDDDELGLVTSSTDRSESDDLVVETIDSWGFVSIFKLLNKIRVWNPDIVHFQFPAIGYGRNPAVNLLPVAMRFCCPGIKVIATIHEFNSLTVLGKSRLLLSINACHEIIIVNDQYKPRISRLSPFNLSVEHIPVGPNITDERPTAKEVKKVREKYEIPQDGKIIGYFGVIRPKKGLGYLLKSFAEFRRENPGTELVFFGHINEKYYNDEFFPLVQDLNLEESVRTTGSVSTKEVSCLFRLSDVCVLPFPEGVTTKRGSFMTAINHSMPIITTSPSKGDLPEGLKDGDNILAVDYGDVGELEKALERIFSQDELRSKLADKAGDLARRYSWDNIADRTMSVYDGLLKS